MISFHLAPWRKYKGVLIGVAFVILLLLWVGVREKGISGVRMIRLASLYGFGWFLVLFGDGTWGDLFTSSLRSYYVVLGSGLLLLSLVRAITILL